MTIKIATTLTKAIRIARNRISLLSFGRCQWRVQEWSPRDNATIEGHMTDHPRAMAQAKEARIRVVLELLGFDDAGAIANGLADEEGNWEDLLRHWYRKYEARRDAPG